jgi:transcriptional regulator, marR family, putative
LTEAAAWFKINLLVDFNPKRRRMPMRDYAQLFSQKLTKSSILINNKISHPEIPEEKLKEYGEAAVGVDISQKEMNILVMLREVGKLTMTDVSREIGAKKPNTTRFVDKMIEKNLIRRRYGVNRDKRYIYLEMTDFAKSLLETRQKIKLDYLTEQMEKNTTQDDREEILKAFDSIISVLSKFD